MLPITEHLKPCTFNSASRSGVTHAQDSKTTTSDILQTPTSGESTVPTSVSTSTYKPVHLTVNFVLVFGISAPLLLVLLGLLTITFLVLIWKKKKNTFNHELEQNSVALDDSNRTSYRDTSNNNWSQLNPAAINVYEETHLTIQPNFTSIEEDGNQGNTYSELPLVVDVDPIYSRVETQSSRRTLGDQGNEVSVISNQNTIESSSAEVTYAVVDKSKKTKGEKNKAEEESCLEAPPVPAYNPIDPDETDQDRSTIAVGHENKTETTIEEMYAVVNKKQRRMKISEEEEAPPIPPHTGEELYTAVMKKPKVSTAEDIEEEYQTIPTHTVEVMYTDVNKIPTASTCNEEEPPPIPPYTVDQL